MIDFNENTFKSIANSQNINGLGWSTISLKVTRKPELFDYSCKFCLCRIIAYTSKDDKVYQIGRLFVPLKGLRNIVFFIQLVLSRKTFGHFVSKNFSGKYEFKLLGTEGPVKGYNIMFNPNSLIKYSKRMIEIKGLNYKFYVEEDCEVS